MDYQIDHTLTKSHFEGMNLQLSSATEMLFPPTEGCNTEDSGLCEIIFFNYHMQPLVPTTSVKHHKRHCAQSRTVVVKSMSVPWMSADNAILSFMHG